MPLLRESRCCAPRPHYWRGLTGEGLSTQFQPVVDLARGTVVGYEALSRFDGYPVSNPELWFDAARRHGCSAAPEALALRRALDARGALPSASTPPSPRLPSAR